MPKPALTSSGQLMDSAIIRGYLQDISTLSRLSRAAVFAGIYTTYLLSIRWDLVPSRVVDLGRKNRRRAGG